MQGSNCQGHACSEDREVPVGCYGAAFTLPSFLPQRMDILGARGASWWLMQLLLAKRLGESVTAEVGYPSVQAKGPPGLMAPRCVAGCEGQAGFPVISLTPLFIWLVTLKPTKTWVTDLEIN